MPQLQDGVGDFGAMGKGSRGNPVDPSSVPQEKMCMVCATWDKPNAMRYIAKKVAWICATCDTKGIKSA